MSAHEFALWQADYARNPWGEERADLRAGIIGATIANWAGKMRPTNATPATPADYMPHFGDDDIVVETEPDPELYFRKFLG